MRLLALLLQSAQPAGAPPPLPPLHGAPREMACPVGGERFSPWRVSSYSTYGARPDGRPYSYLPFPLPLPECPGNRLIVFDAFSSAETAALAQLIETEAYKRLIESETSYYRAYWLATKLDRPRPEALHLLLSAIWQISPGEMAGDVTRESEAQLQRYQALFVREVRRPSPKAEAKERLWMEARAANAARQMGRFGEATKLRGQAEKSLGHVAEKGGWAAYLARLKVVIDRRDTSVEPLDMIPQMRAASLCAEKPPVAAFDRAFCARPDVMGQTETSERSR